MPATALTIAGAGANLAGIGTVAWGSPTRITADDGSYTTAGMPGGGGISNWLVMTTMGFTIPRQAIITRIDVTIEAKYVNAASSVTAATLIVADAVAGTQQTLAQALTTSDATYTFSFTPGQLGYPITPALLNTSTTGMALSVTGGAVAVISVDVGWLTVYYMLAGRALRVRRVRRVNRH